MNRIVLKARIGGSLLKRHDSRVLFVLPFFIRRSSLGSGVVLRTFCGLLVACQVLCKGDLIFLRMM